MRYAITLSSLFLSLIGVAIGAETPTQLPRTIRPTHYEIAVTPDADHLLFSGKVSIDIEVLEPTASITLNQLDLTFSTVALSGGANSAQYGTAKVRTSASDQTATFTFNAPLPKGQYRLAIDYRGKINTQANGLFAIDYDADSGRKRALYTQFENSDARRFIPCWDEPAYKATFALTVTVPSKQVAISNVPIAQTLQGGAVKFATTPKMSTYLLFLGVGDFDRVTAKVGPTEVGVVTQRGLGSQGQFVLESAQAVLREYNDYFGIPYPLPKLDNIASPGRSQFFSAMENWGAIYTFEYALLLNPAISTQADRQGAFGTAAHEIAHQWFGDLVTMSWWDDLWLNEGFATWMAGRTTAKLHPEWNSVLDNVGGRKSAIGLDSLATTHPVVQHVATVEQASQAFDAITYQKGSAVIRMIEEYVGEEAWRDGVRHYIRKHAYANTVSDDLWTEVETAAKKPVLAIAHDFTLQPGVPLIRVGESKCSDNQTMLELTQSEFSKDQPNKKSLTWRVPVIVGSLGAAVGERTVVTGGKANVKIHGCEPVIVNSGQSGYYRTLYSAPHFAQIKSNFAKLKSIDQLGILNDTWTLGLAGYRSASDVLDLATATPATADPKIWQAIADTLDTLNDFYRDDKVRQAKLRAFAVSKLTPIFAQVGWTPRRDESDSTAILRETLIRDLSSAGDSTVIAEAQKRYKESKSNRAAIPPALRKTILSVVAEHADTGVWEQLYADARRERTPLVKDEFFGLLATSENETLLRRALDLSLTDEPGATTSALMIGRAARLHPDLAYDFAMKHLETVDKKVDSSAHSGFYASMASGSSDPAMIGKLRDYANAHLAPDARRDIDTAIARINYRIKVLKERLPAIDIWLAKNSA